MARFPTADTTPSESLRVQKNSALPRPRRQYGSQPAFPRGRQSVRKWVFDRVLDHAWFRDQLAAGLRPRLLPQTRRLGSCISCHVGVALYRVLVSATCVFPAAVSRAWRRRSRNDGAVLRSCIEKPAAPLFVRRWTPAGTLRPQLGEDPALDPARSIEKFPRVWRCISFPARRFSAPPPPELICSSCVSKGNRPGTTTR